MCRYLLCAAAEQVGRRVAYLPDDVIRPHLGRGQRARRVAPAIEIVGGGEGDDPQCVAVAGIAAIQSRTSFTPSACGTVRPSSGMAMPGSVDAIR